MTPAVGLVLAFVVSVFPLPSRGAEAASSASCTPAIGTAAPIGRTPCPGVRPGAFIEVPSADTTCTLGFLLRDAKARRSYMTTAGHCGLPATGQRTWTPDKGPPVNDSSGRRVGSIAFAVMREPLDFALVLVDRNMKPTAQVCHFGGPTGLNAERRNDPAVLEFYGQAQGIASVVPARSGITADTRDTEFVYAQAPIGLGDSGSPWMTEDGRAIGYLTHIVGYGTIPSSDMGLALVRRLGPQLAAAERALATDLTLVTAPRIP